MKKLFSALILIVFFAQPIMAWTLYQEDDSTVLEASETITSTMIAAINSNVDTITANVNQESEIQLTGISPDGFSIPLNLNDVTIEMHPTDLAIIRNGKIVGAQTGSGYLKISADNAVKYIKLVIGDDAVVIEPFEPQRSKASYLSFPQGNAGHAIYSAHIADVGISSLELAYKMTADKGTQVAYAVFDEPVLVPGNPISLRLSVYGDSSNNWLRAKIVDANGTSHSIDFARYINWTGFKTVEAKIPATVKYPVTVERIFVVALDNEFKEVRKVYFDNLTATYLTPNTDLLIPSSSVFTDYKRTDLSNQSESDSFDITFVGLIESKNASTSESYSQTQNENLTEFNNNASYGIIVGASENIETNMPTYNWAGAYDFYNLSTVSFINLVATNDNISSSNAVQWERLYEDLQKAEKNTVIIMNKDPLTALPENELELLQKLFAECEKNLLVVSSDGYESKVTVYNGVRYVNLGDLFNADGTLNTDFKTLRVRFSENDYRYALN